MKKINKLVSIFIMILLLSACGKNRLNTEDNVKTGTPTVQPTKALAENTTEDTTEITLGEARKLVDYYPMIADVEYEYEGVGNEYASYIRVNDFLDEVKGRIQTRTNNGGTETVRVIEIKDGKLSVIKTIDEGYYRDNLMENAIAGDDSEVFLMEPLSQGTQWILKDGSKRYISEVDVDISTPSGNYKAIEVTTEGTDHTIKDYYAPQVGLVKSVFNSGDMEVSSTLKK